MTYVKTTRWQRMSEHRERMQRRKLWRRQVKGSHMSFAAQLERGARIRPNLSARHPALRATMLQLGKPGVVAFTYPRFGDAR